MEEITPTVSTVVAQTNILGLAAADRSRVPVALFQVQTLSDLRDVTFQKALIDFVKQNLDVDFVYKFSLPQLTESLPPWQLMEGHKALLALPDTTGQGLFVGGSSALHYMTGYIKGNNKVNWKSNDVDIFFLNCPQNSRMGGAPGALDFVFCKDQTIEDVLLNFDLPCCRVGFDFKYNYYVSAQALVAIFTGKMYMPEYFASEQEFTKTLTEYNLKPNVGQHHAVVHKMIIERFYERVKKYQSRGFATVYTHLKYVMPWVKNRFTYVDFESRVE